MIHRIIATPPFKGPIEFTAQYIPITKENDRRYINK